ncbi:PorP/SprF family type IX secretion system membrane protein [Flavobacterium rhizosphaerae]|uniref:Type IX secretion system membrane protein PorP/SprF n=1 Tax=Flavobacterium rhizosphaerae TaxID=3163298 RepID=A0ABW8YXL5_9FLAO
MKKNYYFVAVILFVCATAFAQQEPQYTQYMYNTLTVNPGYAGSPGYMQAVLLHRSQWVGIDGAPRTQSFSFQAPLHDANDRMGLGFSAVNDKLGPADEVYVDGNFSYALPVGKAAKLAFGLKAGARMLSVDWARGQYYQQGDPLLNNNINNKIAPTVGAGLYYYTDTYYAGIAIPNFIRNNYYDDVAEAVNQERMHYYIMGGYVFDLNENLKFKPAVLGKVVNGAPITVDVSANFLLHELVTLGASYRWDDSVSALAGFQITRNLFLGYAFDYSVTALNKYNNGSHEFILTYSFMPPPIRIKSPRFF